MTELEGMLKNVTLEYLNTTRIGEEFNRVMESVQKAQEVAYAYAADDSPERLKMMRVGTALTFAVLRKVAQGQSIKDFSEQDWKDIAFNVADNAVIAGGRQWSVIVFSTYADYVDLSVEKLKKLGISDKKCEAIRALAASVRKLENDLSKDRISEVDYTEQCLWLLLESMIKLLAAYSGIFIGEDASELLQSISMLAFEYGRYTLYKQEQEMLELFLLHQQEVDEELRIKHEEYNHALHKREDEFRTLIDQAFAPDIMHRLKATMDIAREAGVQEDEVLTDIGDIDEFFA